MILVVWAAAVNVSGTGLGAGVRAGWGVLQGLAGWAWIVAILGFAGALTARQTNRAATRDAPRGGRPRSPWSRAAGYANQAVLPFYVLHEPVIVAAAWVLVRWHAPVPAKYLALVLMSLAATLGLYEAGVRRYRLTRLLFGMKPPEPAGAQSRERATPAWPVTMSPPGSPQ